MLDPITAGDFEALSTAKSDCPNCWGRGQVSCHACNGSGAPPPYSPHLNVCPSCNGHGTAQCPRCWGSGKIG